MVGPPAKCSAICSTSASALSDYLVFGGLLAQAGGLPCRMHCYLQHFCTSSIGLLGICGTSSTSAIGVVGICITRRETRARAPCLGQGPRPGPGARARGRCAGPALEPGAGARARRPSRGGGPGEPRPSMGTRPRPGTPPPGPEPRQEVQHILMNLITLVQEVQQIPSTPIASGQKCCK